MILIRNSSSFSTLETYFDISRSLSLSLPSSTFSFSREKLSSKSILFHVFIVLVFNPLLLCCVRFFFLLRANVPFPRLIDLFHLFFSLSLRRVLLYNNWFIIIGLFIVPMGRGWPVAPTPQLNLINKSSPSFGRSTTFIVTKTISVPYFVDLRFYFSHCMLIVCLLLLILFCLFFFRVKSFLCVCVSLSG